jgi:hypothetical protein
MRIGRKIGPPLRVDTRVDQVESGNRNFEKYGYGLVFN